MSVSVAAPPTKRRSKTPTAPRAGNFQKPLSVAIYMHDLAGGGVERQSLIIAEELRRHGADVTLVLHRLRGELMDQVPHGLQIVDLKSSRTLMDVPRLVGYLRAKKPDILMSNVDLNNVAALLAKGLSLSQTRIVICQHNPISADFVLGENPLYRFVSKFYRLLSPLISRAVAVSAGVAAELEEIARLPKQRIVTINNPVIGPDFHLRSEASVYHPWFHDPERFVFVTAGRLVPQKDHETMIRALAIHRRHSDSRLLILGSGPLADSLKALVEQLDLTQSVQFLGFQSNVLPYVRQADAFLLSSRCEGFGNVIVEAMGCGTPVIATNCEHGPAEILDKGRYGLLVEPRRPEKMAAAMNEVATLRDRFPPQILQQRAGEFSYTACAGRYMAMFRALAPDRALAV